MARTVFPLNALKLTSSRANSPLTSAMTSGLRRSGLSEPYFSIASRKGMRGNCRRYRLAVRKFVEDAAEHGLDRLEYIFLGDEAHFYVELIEFAGRAVGARVLVTKTWRNLKIAVEARDHQQLLELLRRLRQRVKFARMQARGNKEVARALGRSTR